MNRDTKKYLREMRAEIPCGFFKKKKLLQPFLTSLENFLSDTPDASYSDLADAFGTPKEMAATLCENISEADVRKHRRIHRYISIIAVLVILLLSTWIIKIYRTGPKIEVTRTIVIYDE